MSYRSLLNSTIDIKRQTKVADGQGGYTSTWAVVHRNVPCRFNALASRETTLAYDKQKVFANYYVYLEHLGDVKEGDRIYLGTRAFVVKLIVDWDELSDQMKLAVLEIARGE
jgi:SPP1 family predicted phage head-tail adaptor